MSIITKTIAEQVAIIMLKSKKEELNSLTENFQKLTSEYFLRNIPKDLISVFNKYPSIFQRKSSTRLVGNGIGFNYYKFDRSLPNMDKQVNLSDEEATDFLSLEDEIQNKTKVYETLKTDIENALYNIKTYKNASTMFPEAYPYLPSKTTKAVALNLSGIRSALFSN